MAKRIRQYGKGGFAATRKVLYEAIAGLQEFQSGHLWAMVPVDDWVWLSSYNVGRLASTYHESLRQADYVVLSWETPIAWHIAEHKGDDAYWVIPDEHYSATTNRHQGYVRAALSFANTVSVDHVLKAWPILLVNGNG